MDEQKNPLAELIESSKNVAIIPSQVAGYDAFAAALGFYLTLKEADKEVTLVYPGGIPEGFDDLISESDVMTDPSLRDLIVTIDYHESPARNVKYSTSGDVLTLKMSPVSNDFKLSNVQVKVGSLGFDLIFAIGAQVKEDLGVSYSRLEEEFRNAKIVNLDHTGLNTKYGYINVVDPMMNNLSLLTMHCIIKCGFFINQTAAKALLRGISYRVVN